MAVKKWKPKDEEKRSLIIRSLDEEEKNWMDLWRSVSGDIKSKTTFSIYLEALEEEGDVRKKERRDGKKHRYYSLVRTRYVDEVLRKEPLERKIYATVDFSRLDEEQFLRMMVIVVKRGILPVLRIQIAIGEARRMGGSDMQLKGLLKGYILNLNHHIDLVGKQIYKSIEDKLLDSEKMKDMVGKMLVSETRREFLDMAEQQRGEARSGGLKLVDVEILVKPGQKLGPKDLGLRKIEGISMIPELKELVALMLES